MHSIIGYLKESRLGGPIMLGLVAGAALLYLVYRDRSILYGVGCYFVVVGGIILVSFAARNRHSKSRENR